MLSREIWEKYLKCVEEKNKGKEKYYSVEDGKFHIIKKVPGDHYNGPKYKDISYNNFGKFYRALKKDLDGANLLGYDFEGLNPKKYNLSNAKISSKTMMKLGTYDPNLFQAIDAGKSLATITPSETVALASPRQSNNELEENSDIIYYISDLHINHKLIEHFKDSANQYELEDYLEKLILKMERNRSIPMGTKEKVIIVGDVSFDFENFKLFFKIYREIYPFVQTFFVVGNHDLWDVSLLNKGKSVDGMIEEMRAYLSSLLEPVILLENELYFNDSREIWNEEQILNASEDDWKNIWRINSYAIFGAMGYAGCNNDFNCNNGIYRMALMDHNNEILRSKRTEKLHEKFKSACPNKKIIFVTHMPKEDWTTLDYSTNFIYISGHTHRNYFVETEEKRIYSDNQIGYKSSSFGLKNITISRTYNIFDDYDDGIYEISREDYKAFYRGIGSGLTFNRKFEKLYMLKRNKRYMFLMRAGEANNGLKILNGGSVTNVGRTLEYFYEKMSNYASSVSTFLSDYNDALKKISTEIKKIGGDGRIHGCIVDIDFFNHVYLNPLDGKATSYYADSMTRKFVYKNFISLLKYEAPHLYSNCKMLQSTETENALTILSKASDVESEDSVFVESTDIYKISRIIKSLQFTTDHSIIRTWNDDLVDGVSANNGKKIVELILQLPDKK